MGKIIRSFKKNEFLFQVIFCVFVFIVVAVSATASFIGCSASKKSATAAGRYPMQSMEKKESFAFDSEDLVVNDVITETKINNFSSNRQNATAQNEQVQIDRKLIYTGNISVQVSDLTQTEKNIASWVEKFGGYITSSSISGRYLNVVARIPQKRFNEAFEETSSFGTLLNRSISTQDVTDQYYDVFTRLETRKILRERLESYLKNAPKIEDMISIERELNDVQSEIESMEGQFRRLSNQIDFATIYFDASLPPNTTEQGFVYPDVGRKFSQFWADTLEFLASFLVGIFYFVVFVIPFILAAAFLYFICFGRLGLVKKLFLLAGKKTKKTKDSKE
ncbi:MAG: DUF4349 domain-containing protein [Treponema sp.]|nr:DUF4349 domain-containing protein [Treponema sp.]